MRSFRIQNYLAALWIVFCGFSALAQSTLSPNSATSAGAGGAGRAAVEPIDVHVLNPANLVHLRNRDVHAVAAKDAWAIGITDNSVDNLVAGALSYSKIKTGNEPDRYDHTDLRLSLAGFVVPKFAVGITAHQLMSEISGITYNQNNADLGFSLIATDKLGFGAVLYDLMSSAVDESQAVRVQQKAALGAHWILNHIAALRADVVSAPKSNFDKPTILLGYDSFLNQFLSLRFGWGHDASQKIEYATVGTGLNLPRFRVNYAYQTGIRGDFSVRQSIDFAIPF